MLLPWTAGTDLQIAQPASAMGRFFAENFVRRTGEPLAVVTGDPRRDYNEFYAAMQTWGHYSLVGSPAEADLVIQISIIYIPRQNFTEPFPFFRVALLDPKSNVTLWVLDEFLVDKPNFSMILKKNRDKVFDEAINKLVNDLKVLTAAPAVPAN